MLLCLATYPSPLFHVSAYAQTTGGCVCEDGDTCDSNDLFNGKKWCWATHACQRGRGLHASKRVWDYCTPTVFPRSSVVLEKMTVQACTSGTTFSPVFVTSGFGNFEFHNTHVKDNRATGLFMSGGVGTAVGNSVSLRMRVFLACERARLFLPCAFLLALLTSVTATHPLILFTLHALATPSYQG